MKSLAEQMRNHDREQMSRMAHNLPEQYQECAPVEQVAQVFNKLFNELRAAFPASMAKPECLRIALLPYVADCVAQNYLDLLVRFLTVQLHSLPFPACCQFQIAEP